MRPGSGLLLFRLCLWLDVLGVLDRSGCEKMQIRIPGRFAKNHSTATLEPRLHMEPRLHPIKPSTLPFRSQEDSHILRAANQTRPGPLAFLSASHKDQGHVALVWRSREPVTLSSKRRAPPNRIYVHDMSRPPPLRAPAKATLDLRYAPLSDVSLDEEKTQKKSAAKKAGAKRTLKSIRKKGVPTPPGVGEKRIKASKYMSKNTQHLLEMQCFLLDNNRAVPDGFASKADLLEKVKHYHKNVLPLRSDLKGKIGAYNASLANNAPDWKLAELRIEVERVEQFLDAALETLPQWAGCTVENAPFMHTVRPCASEDSVSYCVDVPVDTVSK